MNRDGSGLINLTRNSAFDGYPSWSPDGKWILFASNMGRENPEESNLFAIRPDGSGLVQLTTSLPGVWQSRQMVSADGKKLVFNRDFPDGEIDIFVMDFNPEDKN